MKALLPPVGILLGAWMLGSTLTDLGANAFIARLVSDNLALWAVPAVVFATGAAIAFSTGTSWGTMALLMPLSIEVLGSHPQLAADPAAGGALFPAIIAAVFSGAVFGDHCSPISDTTIVSSIATGVEPVDHVKTQMPFALIAAAVALLLGFLPAGFGLPGWLGLLLGAGLLGTLVLFGTRGGRATSA
jgi:Na+/H+ antiporter NhaC